MVLEGGRQVDLDRVRLGKLAERGLGQGRGAVLHRAAHAVVLARGLGEVAQRVEVDRDVGDRAVRQDDAAVRRAGLDADLGDARQIDLPACCRSRSCSSVRYAVHEGVQILHRGVAQADLADLAADRDGDALRLDARG